MVGGDAATLDAHRDVLSAFAATVVHVGPVGSGLIVKLVNNLLLFAGVAAACEGLALGAAAGLERGKLDAAVRAATGDSLAYRAVADRARSGDYSASFTLDIGYKDVRLALQLADELGVPAPVGAGVHNLMRVARGMGFGAADPTVMLRVYETLNAPGTTRR
jgi:3-hydroxyisobutyrate dehydrogenase-like beta-hydroxyacid dehydrogenase